MGTRLRFGIDIVDVARLQRVLEEYPALEARLFTQSEREYAAKGRRRYERLAARVAAKEATFKALGDGWPRISWHDVEVVPSADGPRLNLTGKAAELAGDAEVLVSLAHDAGIAIAQVILVL